MELPRDVWRDCIGKHMCAACISRMAQTCKGMRATFKNNPKVSEWKLFVRLRHNDAEESLLKAINDRSPCLTNVMIRRVESRRLGFAFQKACYTGDREIVDIFIANGTLPWNNGLYYAIFGHHADIAHLMIRCGATDWNLGLRAACYKGDRRLVDLMIEKGADDWSAGFAEAIRGRHVAIAELMIEKGVRPGLIKFECLCINFYRKDSPAIAEILERYMREH